MKPTLPKNGLKAWTEFYESGQVIATKYHDDTRGMTRSRIFSEERAKELLRREKEWLHDQATVIDLRPMEDR